MDPTSNPTPANQEETEEIAVTLTDAEDSVSDAAALSVNKAQVLRVEENVSANWSGVRDCGNAQQVNAEARRALESWAKDKMFQYRHLRYIRYGAGAGTGRVTQSDSGWGGGGRSCRAYITMPCYIEFFQP